MSKKSLQEPSPSRLIGGSRGEAGGGAKVRVEFWMADRLGWDTPGPVVVEEELQERDSLRAVLNRLAEKNSYFPEAVFDPVTQSLSSEVSLILNGHTSLPQGLDTRLKDGDRILFLPILAGG